MKIEYIEREINFADILHEELPKDVKWILDFFKDLTYRYEKKENSLEIWFDKDGHWTIQICEKKTNYTHFYYKIWDFLQDKYGLNYIQTRDLVHYLLELTLKRKVSTPPYLSLFDLIGWS